VQHVSQFAEIVLVTRLPYGATFELMHSLDPMGLIPFRLAQEHWAAPRALRPQIRRDLRRLNRDLSTVLVLDHSAASYDQPENVLVLPSKGWATKAGDTELYELVPFLHAMSDAVKGRQNDVRPMLAQLDGVDVPKLMRGLVVELMEQRAAAKGAPQHSLEDEGLPGELQAPPPPRVYLNMRPSETDPQPAPPPV